MRHGRRDVLCAAGGLCSATVAGCLGEPVESQESADPLYASFFTLAEFTAAVADDTRTVENAVPDGEHGHAWEPSTTPAPNSRMSPTSR